MIFESGAVLSARPTLKNHQKWQKVGKKRRKALFNLHYTHFSIALRVPFGIPPAINIIEEGMIFGFEANSATTITRIFIALFFNF